MDTYACVLLGVLLEEDQLRELLDFQSKCVLPALPLNVLRGLLFEILCGVLYTSSRQGRSKVARATIVKLSERGCDVHHHYTI